MDRLRELATALVAERGLPLKLELEGDTLIAWIGKAGRTQRIRLGRSHDDYLLTSTVVGRVTRRPKERRTLLLRAWIQNDRSELVSFGIDGRGRLIGQCRHPAVHLDLQELKLYVVALARECDRLEWVLTGEDRF